MGADQDNARPDVRATAADSRTAVPAEFSPSAADLSTFGLLSTAKYALSELDQPQAEVDRRSSYYSALSSLTALYQLHGCAWALPALLRLRAQPDCPDMHLGYRADGRVALRLEPLELHNPAFAEYTIYLLTLESNTAREQAIADPQQLAISLLGGTVLTAEALTPKHRLWTNLSNLANTFAPRQSLVPGSTYSFKQIIAVPKLSPSSIGAVELRWRGTRIVAPYYENAADGRREDHPN